MDVTRRLALLLTVLQGIPAGDSAPNPSPLVGSNWGNPRRYIHLQTSTDLNNFYLEIKLDGTVCKATSRTSYSVILLKAESRERVAIMGVKSSRYLCMDLEGNPFSSPTCLRDQCLFNHRILENNRDVYYSIRTGILLNLEGSRQVFAVGQNLPQTALFLPKKNTVPLERLLLHREKRNEEVSDSRAVQEEDADLEIEMEPELEVGDDGRNVSRETPMVPSDHDPWNVYTASLGSPRSSGVMG
ncbi:fibroblast growth factor 23 [Gouania willdenowi]|uniref:Fibroblast growth factor 23 n=1 Tax=Gouania willdenowi TaxID=441366 RepID=A0A8C5DTS5_GOUWI|nr:fibroblast growth factor 23 [Gouania willdenowi]